MATEIKFYKVTALPGTPEANSVYWVKKAVGNRADCYVTDASGLPYEAGNEDFILNIINGLSGVANGLAELDAGGKVPMSQLPFSLSDVIEFKIVDTHADRIALILDKDTLVLVLDASGDATVTTGAAMYAWDNTGGVWQKVTEFESLDIQWANITGKPNVTAADIEDAVAKKHSHTNLTQLNKIGEDAGGAMTYNGQGVTAWKQTAW